MTGGTGCTGGMGRAEGAAVHRGIERRTQPAQSRAVLPSLVPRKLNWISCAPAHLTAVLSHVKRILLDLILKILDCSALLSVMWCFFGFLSQVCKKSTKSSSDVASLLVGVLLQESNTSVSVL